MWIQELGSYYEENMIEEGWGGISVDSSKRTPNVKAPNQASPGLTYQNNKIGTKTASMSQSSGAGNVMFGNPYEQEESAAGVISKEKILNLISELENDLDGSDNADRGAIMVLNKLKKAIT